MNYLVYDLDFEILNSDHQITNWFTNALYDLCSSHYLNREWGYCIHKTVFQIASGLVKKMTNMGSDMGLIILWVLEVIFG